MTHGTAPWVHWSLVVVVMVVLGLTLPSSTQALSQSIGLRSLRLPESLSVKEIRFYKLSLQLVEDISSNKTPQHLCGIVVDVKRNPTESKNPELNLDCYAGNQHLSPQLTMDWIDPTSSSVLASLLHPSATSSIAFIRATEPTTQLECSVLLNLTVNHCNLRLGNFTLTQTRSEVVELGPEGQQWRQANTFVPASALTHRKPQLRTVEYILEAVAAAQRVCHVAEQTIAKNSGNGGISLLEVSASSEKMESSSVGNYSDQHPGLSRWFKVKVQERLNWHSRLEHSRSRQRETHLTTLRRLAPLWKGNSGSIRDMSLTHSHAISTRRDIGDASGIETQVMSCSEMMTMESSMLAAAVSSRLTERIKAESTFPSFIIQPLMVAFLAPVSQQIEKKAGPLAGPILSLIYTLILQLPLACHLVGYLCHQMGTHLADVLIEALTYKCTDYIISAVEGTLARDISSIMIMTIASWFQQSVVPEATIKLAELMPAVITPGLSAAVANGVVMAVTKPLTHALKGPVLAYYYCQYCYSYGTFCDFCVNDDLEAMDKGWWLDI